MKEYRKISQKIYRQQYALLYLFALWQISPKAKDYLKLIYNIYYWYMLIFWVLLFDFGMLLQMIRQIGSLEEVTKVVFMLATEIAVLGKLITVKTKNESFDQFFKQTMHREYLPQNLEERKIYVACIDLNIKVRNFYAGLSYISCGAMLMTNVFLSDTRELPVNVYNPFSLAIDWKYNVIYGYVCLAIFLSCSVNVAFDTLTSAFFIHLKGQLDILGHRLENIGKNPNSSQDFILQQLKECIRQYNRILQLSHDIENLISKPNSLQIGCSVFVLVANFYAMSMVSDSGQVGNFIKIAIYQACMLSQIFILCYFANEVSLKSSEISFNLYTSNWYNWNKVNRKLALQMMLRFATPIRISSINSYYSFNLPAFTSIVNSSYSYFALLKRFNE